MSINDYKPGEIFQNNLKPMKKLRPLKKVSYQQPDKRGTYKKVAKRLSEEEALKKGFNDNQGLYLVLGTLYRDSFGSWVHTIVFIIACLFMLFCLGRQTLLITDDLSLLFETIHYITIIGGVLVIVPPMMKNQFRFQKIFKIFAREVYCYDYLDEETAQEILRLRAEGNKEKQLLTKAFTVMLLGTFAGFSVLLPGMYIINGQFFAPQREDGVIMGIPCVIWFPFRVDDKWVVTVRILLLALEEYASFTVVAFIIGQQTTAICIGHTLLYEFKVLALTMNKFEQRAKLMDKKFIGDGTLKPASQTRKYITSCLNESIKHHDVLLDVSEQYSSIFYVPELVILLSSTMVICLSAVSLTSDNIPLEAKAVSVIFTGAEMMNVFVNCYYGQILLDAHNIIGDAMYESNWTSYSSIVHQHVLIILSRVQKPLSLTAGGFAAVNLDTFAQVVKSSFSYFSLLQALKE
uniref:Odorant receptor n=1 Tax=Adelphocoris lineolatus TaxID=236346 RepID=A0A2I4PGZ8_ADELI|nr:olfactory receptor 1 [Adelphocoris lineolatus]